MGTSPFRVSTPILLLFSIHFGSVTLSTISEKCLTCKKLTEAFMQGLNLTSLRNYEGGNTDWESRNLKKYSISESRFLHITEQLCKNDFNCDTFLEENEHLLYKWYENQGDLNLFDWLCINNSKLCCPDDAFGPECLPCPMKDGKVCSNNGKCSGAGIRDGTGVCICKPNFVGSICSNCNDGFYASGSSGDLECYECHNNCKACFGPSSKECSDCHFGYQLINSECIACHHSCVGCSGSKDVDCVQCKNGYIHMFSGRCHSVKRICYTVLSLALTVLFEVFFFKYRSYRWIHVMTFVVLTVLVIVYICL